MKRIFVLWAFAAVLSWGSVARALEPIKLADGVYGIKGPGEAFNTAFVVGERGVFVFGCDLSTYDERLQAIRSVASGKAIRFVANGHYAFDDSGCNHLFAEQGAIVIGNPEFARLLLPYWPKQVASRLKEGRGKKEHLQGKRVEMAMPAILFSDKLTLDLGTHVLELQFVGKAHTTDNNIVWLPKEKILFTDDLVFTELHPTADARSDTVNWQRILRNLASWSPTTVVPGHGVFAAGNGTKPLLDQDRYFGTMRAKVKAMMEAGRSLEEIKKGVRAELGEFAKWPRERAIPGTAEQFYRELGGKR